ncbi:fimbrial protein [Escherichia coli]|nr:fimbrial protein [Escherichia coli]
MLHRFLIKFIILFYFPPFYIKASEVLEKSLDLNLTVAINTPVCKLKTGTVDVDFGDIKISEIRNNIVNHQQINLILDECDSVSEVELSFTGEQVRQDGESFYLENKLSDNHARNIGVKLYDKNKVELPINYSINLNETESGSLIFYARPVELHGATTHSGIIDTNAIVTITYN